MQILKNIVKIVLVAISLPSRGLDHENVFLHKKMCMPGGRRLAYNISFQETVHFERGPLHFYHFLSHAFANVLR